MRAWAGILALALCLAPGAAFAQHGGHGRAAPTEAAPYGPPVADRHVWSHVLVDSLEARLGRGDPGVHWDGEAWIGPDGWRIWLKSEGELDEGDVEHARVEAFYSRPATTFWDLQAGLRQDVGRGPDRTWAALGIEGLAPGFVHISAHAYVGEGGRVAGRVKASYEQLLTQRLILGPEVAIDLYGRDDPAGRAAAGLSDIEASLRLRYEITRKFAPYVGVVHARSFGAAADMARRAGEDVSETRLTVGVRAWY